MTFDPAVSQETGASGRRYQGIILTGWIRCNCDAHVKQVNVKQFYNPVLELESVTWSQLQLKFELQFKAVRTSSQQTAWAPRTPGLSSPVEWERSAAIMRGTWGQHVAVCSVSTHLSHITLSQPFRNPFE